MSRAPSVVRTLRLAMMGTGLGMGLAFPLVVAPFAEYRPGLRLAFASLCVLAGLVVGALNFYLVRFFLLRPVERVGRQLETLARGEGVSATRLTLESNDALGRLVQQFNALIDRLQTTLNEVIEIVGAFVAHADETGQTARELVDNVDRKSQVVAGTATLFAGMRQELETIAQILGRLRESAAESRDAVGAQTRQMGAVTDRVAQFRARSEASAGAIERAGAALERTGASTGDLTRELEGAAASMTQMDATVREIDRHLAEATAFAERVATEATAGDRAVSSTREAMERIRESVGAAATAIGELGRRVGEIAAVTGVIDEVTEQTGLLALNAAIIAAQAGEHGRGFAVVAGQIKSLASRTADSTREINGIVSAFHAQAQASLGSMGESRALVDEGAALSGLAAEALGAIKESAAGSLRRVQAIGRSTGEIAAAAHVLSGTVDSIAARAREIATATAEQGREIATWRATVDEGRRATADIVAATGEQGVLAQRIERQAEAVVDLVESSGAAVREGRGQTDMLATTIETLQDLDARERGSFGRIQVDAGLLSEKAQALRREIERLKPGGGDGGHGGEAAGSGS